MTFYVTVVELATLPVAAGLGLDGGLMMIPGTVMLIIAGNRKAK